MGPPPPPPPAPPGGDEAEGAEDAEAAPTFPHYVEMLNKGVVILQHVSDPRFRRTYAQLLDGRVTPGGRVSPEAPDGRVSVRVLPIEIRRAPPPVLPRAPIRVRADAIRAVGRMRYYTAAHPDVAAQMATPERLAAQSVPREFADSQAVVTVGVPSGTMAARLYVDCRPPDETPGLLQLMEVNAHDYDRDTQTGATAKLFEDRICKGALPPPEVYIYHVPVAAEVPQPPAQGPAPSPPASPPGSEDEHRGSESHIPGWRGQLVSAEAAQQAYLDWVNGPGPGGGAMSQCRRRRDAALEAIVAAVLGDATHVTAAPAIVPSTVPDALPAAAPAMPPAHSRFTREIDG